jgi:choline dehydrogenase-like flavoprotein
MRRHAPSGAAVIANFRGADTPTAFDTDVCIIGSGAAGLTLASHVAGKLRVLIVEAGDAAPTRGADDWLAGEAGDFAFNGFQDGRMRAFGGATRLWAGQLLRLDAIDFEKRDWVLHSGWPITLKDLEPSYDRAERFLGVAAPLYDARIWSRFGVRDPGFANDIVPKFTVYMPQRDFTKAFGAQMVRTNPSIDLLLNATVLQIDLDPGATRVVGVQIGEAGGRRGAIRARAFVLCGGGIENPRLLLASNSVMPTGIGNAHDLVGRFFQDHPNGAAGVVTTAQPRVFQEQFRKLRRNRVTAWPKLSFTEAAQRRGRYLNANAMMEYEYADGSALTRAKTLVEAVRARRPAAILRGGMRLLRHVPELAAQAAHTAATGKALRFDPARIKLQTFVEPVPDPESRVKLSTARDRFGIPRPHLTWRIHPDELRTMRAFAVAAGAEFHRLGLGELTVAPWLNQGVAAARAEIKEYFHHAGATRMASSPADGVTDPDCRVFGTDNLYIAGGSVFPTCGYANPTLTIVALAIRLADTLRARLEPG